MAKSAAATAEKPVRNRIPTKSVGEKPATSRVTVTVRGRDADGAKTGLRYVVDGQTYAAVLDRIEQAVTAAE